jgi:hypothetical protein
LKTITAIETYPLSWPEGVRRASVRQRSRFEERGQTVLRVRRFLKDEIRRLGGQDVIISTDMRTRQDGEPIANAREPDDPGAAVYFELKGNKVCLACDHWKRLWENLYAIGRTIEAMRAIDRWGVSDLLDRMFTGFIAITQDAGKSWAAILGVEPTATIDAIKKAYRERMRENHPDAGGETATAAEINQAYETALREREENKG